MITDRRSLLKGLAAAGLLMASTPWAQAATANEPPVAADSPAPTSVTSLVSGSPLDAAFLRGVHHGAQGVGHGLAAQPLQGLDARTYTQLDRLLQDGEPTLLVGLLDDAAATLVMDLVRGHGGRVLSVQAHRVDGQATPWAEALGQALVGQPGQAPQAPATATASTSRSYVSLSCVI